MLSGATSRACAMLGTAVLRMVVSSDCMKNATATSHGSSGLGGGAASVCSSVFILQRSSAQWPQGPQDTSAPELQRLRPGLGRAPATAKSAGSDRCFAVCRSGNSADIQCRCLTVTLQTVGQC